MNTSTQKWKHNYFYKITFQDTGQFYYGIHSTNNLNDGYMGSGSLIKKFIKLYGKEKFTKEILANFDNREDLSNYEQDVVNEELLKDPMCLNLVLGGDWSNPLITTKGLATVRDKDGNRFDVKIDDPRYLSGDLVPCTKGRVVVRDEKGMCMSVKTDDPDYISGKYVIITKGNKAMTGKTIIYKDGLYLTIDKTDLQKYIDLGWEIRSKCRGRVSPTKGLVHLYKDGESIMVERSEMDNYINEGWENKRDVKPLLNTICLTKDGRNLYVDPDTKDAYINDGWKVGGTSRNKGKLTCTLDGGKTYIQLDKNDPLVLSGKAKTAFQLREPSCKGLKYIHKGDVVKRVKEIDIDKYIKLGYKLGIKDKKKS